MNLRALDWLGWTLSFVTLAAFFLPWFKFSEPNRPAHAARHELVAQLKASSERSFASAYLEVDPHEQARALYKPMRGTAGYELPLLEQEPANARQVAILANSRLFGESRVVDRMRLVYAVPALALFAAAFLSGCRKKWPLFLPLSACTFAYGLARYQLNETYFERMTSGLDAGIGLWISLYGLLALCILLLLRIVLPAGWKI